MQSADQVRTQFRSLEERICAGLAVIVQDENYPDAVARAHPGASANAIARLEAHYGVEMPPSYKVVLGLHDGYEALAYPGHLLGAADSLPGGRYHDYIMKWKDRIAKAGSPEVLNAIVIASSGQPNDWVYLDPAQPLGSGEFAVVEFTPEQSTVYQGVLDYLETGVLAFLDFIQNKYGLR